MPMLDMPLEELREYRGTNPKPEDFREYWEKAVDEMKTVDPQVELIKAEFQAPFAECFHMYYTGVRGARIHAKLILPKRAERPSPAVVMFHGYTDSSRWWNDKLQYAAAGFVVAAMDCRGQGGLSEDVGGVKGTTVNGHIIRGMDGDKEDFLMRHIFLDAAQLAGILMDCPDVDETRVCATGGSQGGGLTLACAALEPRIRRIGLCYPFLSDYKRVWDMDLAVDAYAEIRTYFRLFDPLHQREEEIFQRLGYLDVHHLADLVRAETLMGISMSDTVCPPSTQFAAYNHLRTQKEAMLFWDYGHEDLPGFSDSVYQYFMELL